MNTPRKRKAKDEEDPRHVRICGEREIRLCGALPAWALRLASQILGPSSVFHLGSCSKALRKSLVLAVKLRDDLAPEMISCLARAFDGGLEEINFTGNLRLRKLPATISCAGALRRLSLTGCKFLGNISALAGLTSLRTLLLRGCSKIIDVSSIGNCPCLTSLDLSKCWRISSVSALSKCIKLRTLKLEKITDISCVNHMPQLQILALPCSDIVDISALAGCSSLASLDLSYCSKIKDFSPLASCAALSQVILTACSHYADLDTGEPQIFSNTWLDCRFDQMKSLVALTPSPISPNTGAPHLRYLDLSGTGIKTVQHLSHCNTLRELNLSCCTQLESIQPLVLESSQDYCRLEILVISSCHKLADVYKDDAKAMAALLTKMSSLKFVEVEDWPCEFQTDLTTHFQKSSSTTTTILSTQIHYRWPWPRSAKGVIQGCMKSSNLRRIGMITNAEGRGRGQQSQIPVSGVAGSSSSSSTSTSSTPASTPAPTPALQHPFSHFAGECS